MICEETNRNIFCSTCLLASPLVPYTTRKEKQTNKTGKHALPKAIFQDKHSSQSALMKVKSRRTSTQKQTYRIEVILIFPSQKSTKDQVAGGGHGERRKKKKKTQLIANWEKKKNKSPFSVVGRHARSLPKRKQRQKVGKCGRVARRRAAPALGRELRASLLSFCPLSV